MYCRCIAEARATVVYDIWPSLKNGITEPGVVVEEKFVSEKVGMGSASFILLCYYLR